ncbi:MAG: hypothetical protein ABII85_01685 [Bacillota bacterium]
MEKEKINIKNEKVVTVIREAKTALTEAILFYGLLKQNDTTLGSKEKEIKSIIDGTSYRLMKMGVSEEEIKSIDWSIDSNVNVFYKDWCKDNNLNFYDFKSLQAYQSQGGSVA